MEEDAVIRTRRSGFGHGALVLSVLAAVFSMCASAFAQDDPAVPCNFACRLWLGARPPEAPPPPPPVTYAPEVQQTDPGAIPSSPPPAGQDVSQPSKAGIVSDDRAYNPDVQERRPQMSADDTAFHPNRRKRMQHSARRYRPEPNLAPPTRDAGIDKGPDGTMADPHVGRRRISHSAGLRSAQTAVPPRAGPVSSPASLLAPAPASTEARVESEDDPLETGTIRALHRHHAEVPQKPVQRYLWFRVSSTVHLVQDLDKRTISASDQDPVLSHLIADTFDKAGVKPNLLHSANAIALQRLDRDEIAAVLVSIGPNRKDASRNPHLMKLAIQTPDPLALVESQNKDRLPLTPR